MTINVYWTTLESTWMRAREPQPVLKNLYERRLHEERTLMRYHRCPFVHEELVNVFSLHSPYSYSFSVDENNHVSSKMYDQDFFDAHVNIRSAEKKMFSFFVPFIFFTEEKSLKMSLKYPNLENNNVTKRCMMIEGTIDIGKYFRNIDFPFFIKDPYNDFIIEEDEIFSYIKFDTKKKIKFIKFYPTDKIKKFSYEAGNANLYKKVSFSSTDFFYNRFSIKNNVLKEIKNNIVE